MGINAFIIKDTTPGIRFARSFLASKEFTDYMLKEIGSHLEIPKSSKRNQLFDKIAENYENKRLQKEIIRILVERRRNWLSFKLCDSQIDVNCSFSDPSELVFSMGNENLFYGPIQTQRDPDALWLIKPTFVDHIDRGGKSIIRWLTYIRIWKNIISIHWGGFRHTDDENRIEKEDRQFEYWKEIPKTFDEIEKLLNIRLRNVLLDRLVLHDLWNEYRRNPNYYWIDRRVRAEASGIFLNARSGGMLDITLDREDRGLNSLASSIWSAIQIEFEERYSQIELPRDHEFREVILGTIIRDLGAISYEFELSSIENEKIIRGHFYFGNKPNSSSADSFPHINLLIKDFNDLHQLYFLIRHIGDKHVDRPRQSKLL